jgi:LuxR family transcriptional regulator, transcriptional activator of the bioluminescence operon
MTSSKNTESRMNFLQEVDNAASVFALKASLKALASSLGYDFYAVHVRLASSQKKDISLHMLTNYPHRWLTEYKTNNYIVTDPLFNAVGNTCLPVIWDDVDKKWPSVGHSSGRNIMSEAKKHGLNSGVSIQSGAGGFISFGSKKSHHEMVEVINDTLSFLAGVANCSCCRLNYLLGKKSFGHIALSQREIDCLSLSSQGMRASNIAASLNLSERTVYFHMNAAKEKFHASTIAEVLSKIMSLGASNDFLKPQCNISVV